MESSRLEMRKILRHRGAGMWAGSMAAVLAIAAAPAEAAPEQWTSKAASFSLPEQDLARSLLEFAQQAGVQLVMNASDLRGYRAPAVTGPHTPAQLLKLLLGSAPVSAQWAGTNTLVIRQQAPLRKIALQTQPATSTPAPMAAPSANSESRGLEEIVVTAQRRGQNLQNVPLAVTAFSENTLTTTGITAVREISQLDPSLNISSNSGVILPYLRGIGNAAASVIGNEASVPVYIDDVYYTRLAPAYLELANVARVEVLKGPQGTLFGRNASGGAIQIFTKDPGSQTEVEGRIGYGNYDTVRGQLYVSTPIAEGIGANLSVSASDQGKGWGKNLFNGEGTYKNKFINVRSKIVAELSDTTKVRLSAFYATQKSGQGQVQNRFVGTVGGTPPLYGPVTPVLPQDFYDYNNSFNGYVRNKGWGVSAKIEQDLDFAQLVSVTAYRKAREYFLAEGDFTPLNFLKYELHQRDRQISQELQLKSQAGSAVDWIVGAYYLNSKSANAPIRVTGDAFTSQGLAAFEIYGRQTIRSLSAYGQATFKVVPEGTNITLGLRYTSDQVHGVGSQLAVLAGGGTAPAQTPYDDKFRFNKLTYKVALDHHFNDNMMAYLSFSRGYKSGTFNLAPLDSDPSRPETVQAYEFGVKSELFDRHLRINAAIFQNDVGNPQVRTVIVRNGAAFNGLTNAKAARIRGAEINGDALLGDGLTVRASATYLDAKYTDFVNAPFFFPVVGSPYGLRDPVPGVANGNRIAEAPRWRAAGGVNYSRATGFGRLVGDVNVSHTGSFAWAPDNFNVEKPYTLINGSLTIYPDDDERFSIAIWGKNLTGSHYYLAAQENAGGGGNVVSPGAPRTYGIDFGFKF